MWWAGFFTGGFVGLLLGAGIALGAAFSGAYLASLPDEYDDNEFAAGDAQSLSRKC